MSAAPLRTWLEISGPALRANVATLRKQVGVEPGLIAMVKANAYGHGMIPVARELLNTGEIAALGVADIDELRALRAARIETPVLLCSAALPGEMGEIVALRGQPTLSTLAEAKHLNTAARQAGTVAAAHFKLDTGMGRLGLPAAEAATALRAILRLPHLRIVALYTHCARADDNGGFTRKQAALFAAWRENFPGFPWHLANSAAILGDPAFHGDFVRPGLALYGLPPRPEDKAHLRPVMTWKTRITLLRRAAKGTTVSYGGTYRLPQPQTLATLAVGYGDGYPRVLSNRAEVLLGGKRCPVRGRVTMDQIIIDASTVPAAKVGTEVVLLGQQGKQEITADELAHLAGTINYEIVTGTSDRLPRLYRGFKALPPRPPS